MSVEYQKFLESKRHSTIDYGIKPLFIPDKMFDFQKFVSEKLINKGRFGGFLDTGLGKTIIELTTAYNYLIQTNKPVLIITPLAVAFQFVTEAEKFGINDVFYSRNGKFSGKKIVLCNYERLHLFNHNNFDCVILDESSILKNFNGKIKDQITSFLKKVKYRFLFTATPSPNDFIELGTSSEALGYMGYMDMLTKFFKNNQNSVDSTNRNIGEKFYLKPHAEDDFFAWVNTWSITVKKPSDIGFSDENYILPNLNINKHIVKNQSLIDVNGQIQMFTPIAKSMTEVRHEQKQTEKERSEKAFELSYGKVSVYWCNTNNESKLLREIDTEAVEIIGSQTIERKEEILVAFSKGEIDRIITKAKITGMGLNWQHCHNTVFFPTWSYEQFYQSLRRFWRFGQKNDVNCHLVVSDGQKRVLDSLDQKAEKARIHYKKIQENINRNFSDIRKQFSKTIIKPSFL